mmetsp:Transcript_35545/g.111205  ORF Transcript_35545/g.111205 Transcript_35545/m.111205 type:complete len:239 (-) Transcript_35545:1262-1978(-)
MGPPVEVPGRCLPRAPDVHPLHDVAGRRGCALPDHSRGQARELLGSAGQLAVKGGAGPLGPEPNDPAAEHDETEAVAGALPVLVEGSDKADGLQRLPAGADGPGQVQQLDHRAAGRRSVSVGEEEGPGAWGLVREEVLPQPPRWPCDAAGEVEAALGQLLLGWEGQTLRALVLPQRLLGGEGDKRQRDHAGGQGVPPGNVCQTDWNGRGCQRRAQGHSFLVEDACERGLGPVGRSELV